MNGLLSICAALTLATAADPELHSQKPRLLFRTVAGDMVFTLNPSIAPNTCRKLCELTANGVYNGTHFHRFEPNFVLQLSNAEDRLTPLSAEQKSLIHNLKAEFNGMKHRKGALSMARMDNDPDSAQTSFSILLGDAPHLDGKYTIFGEMTHGWEVVELFNQVPRRGSAPIVRLTVNEAYYVPPGETLPELKLFHVNPKAKAEAEAALASPGYSANQPLSFAGSATAELIKVAAVTIGFLLLIGLANTALSGRIAPARLRSINLLGVLVGVVLFMIVATPLTAQYPWVGIILFFGLLCIFKIMGSFETAS